MERKQDYSKMHLYQLNNMKKGLEGLRKRYTVLKIAAIAAIGLCFLGIAAMAENETPNMLSLKVKLVVSVIALVCMIVSVPVVEWAEHKTRVINKHLSEITGAISEKK